jgi:acetyl esterase/lipase
MRSEKRTYTYKTVGECEIKADVYSSFDGQARPVIVWVHGGALIMGHREDLPLRERDLYLAGGYQVVSVDYRLAPETKLAAIIEDVQDACEWVREAGPGLFDGQPERTALIGHSAGGYLALMGGFRVEPRPKALVSFYGYGDIVGPWYSRPDPFYRQQPLVTADEAWASVGQTVLSGSHDEQRERFYLYCRQQGLWPKEVAGHDPETEPAAFVPLCPARNVTRGYPPTLLLHGDRDTDVPYEQSAMMAEALAAAGVEHELVTIPGGEHGFDAQDDAVSADAFERVAAFLEARL